MTTNKFVVFDMGSFLLAFPTWQAPIVSQPIPLKHQEIGAPLFPTSPPEDMKSFYTSLWNRPRLFNLSIEIYQTPRPASIIQTAERGEVIFGEITSFSNITPHWGSNATFIPVIEEVPIEHEGRVHIRQVPKPWLQLICTSELEVENYIHLPLELIP